MDNMTIKEFKIENMCENPTILIIAKRGSGMSWILRDILRLQHDDPCGIIISPTKLIPADHLKN